MTHKADDRHLATNDVHRVVDERESNKFNICSTHLKVPHLNPVHSLQVPALARRSIGGRIPTATIFQALPSVFQPVLPATIEF